MIANLDRGQLNRKMFSRLSPFVITPENLVSRDGFGRPVSRQPAQYSQHRGGIWFKEKSERI